MGAAAAEATVATLGLRANWKQFALLVLVNAFVGAMAGLERTVMPLVAEDDFGLASRSAMFSFIATFGLVKALTNLMAGALGDRWGRKRVLVAGWLAGLPVPLLIIWAPTWSWIVAANVLLGVNQGLAWSATIIMKIDLVGPRRRGLAMGLNEFAGYIAVALAALATGEIASRYGLRPEPFYLGIAFAALGLAVSLFFVRDTTPHARLESASHNPPHTVGFRDVFALTSWRHPALSSASQVGLVNNLNDGLAWGLFPLFFAAAGLPVREIGILAFMYPATWGVAQLWTGALSDRVGRKRLIVGGMVLQGAALLAIALSRSFAAWMVGAAILGLGTAMVYPTLLAAIGVYRLWRDMGYVVGALLGGFAADAVGLAAAIAIVGVITTASGALAAWRMQETLVAPGAS